MKKLLVISVILIQVNISRGQNPTLELKVNLDNIILGETLLLTLKINDPKINEILERERYRIIEDESSSVFFPQSFSMTFKIEPTDTGLIKTGPYKLTYQDKALTSNPIFVRVSGMKGQKGVILFDVLSQVRCNSTGDIRIRSHSLDVTKWVLKESDYFSISNTCSSSSSNTIDDKVEKEYIITFIVEFIKKGLLELNMNSIKNLPASCAIEPVTISIV